MPDPKVTPPAGYNLQDLPDFLRQSNIGTKTVSAPPIHIGNASVVADVDPNNPTTIAVREPSLYTPAVRTHESTHVFQMSRNPAFAANIQGQAQATNTNAFDYGGVEGLLAAQKAHKDISHFSAEQQATMVADYQRLVGEALKKRDAAGLSKVTSAYHPYISQLASVPPKGANMTKMTRQDLTPPAPGGVPSTPVAGMLLMPDPLIGGQIVPSNASQSRRIGESKKFSNGKIGVWDGHGWEQR